ncbi:MAG: arginyltransferase [Desulfomonile tiedjei]|nr:arginyltransferase [Desulfomonile tiedjei]
MADPHRERKSSRDRRYRVVSPFFGLLPLDFLVTGEEHPCPYLPSLQAREELFAAADLHAELYHDLMDLGFRRAGTIFYRPVCRSCAECRPLRVPVSEFRPTKSQRRVLAKNQDTEVVVRAPRFTQEKFRIYSDYLRTHHGSAEATTPEEFQRSLYTSPVATLEFEYRIRGRLVAASIADVSSRSLSSVYVYYDVGVDSRSMGTFSAMREILFCAEHGIPFYYLGFHVADCPAMSYKARFRPNEILSPDLNWIRQSLPARPPAVSA